MSAPLFSAQELVKTFGVKTLFEGITFSIMPAERVALIGPNGSGKSTLLKIVAGLETVDTGAVYPRRDLHSSYISQEDIFNEAETPRGILVKTLVDLGHEEYQIEHRVESALRDAGFTDINAQISSLSGGWKKRLSILRGLITDPELLLLDEPTNHLDIEGVLWLEDLLSSAPFAVVFVSHDRYFISRLAQRVFEINRRYPQGYFTCNGDYSDFLEARALHLEGLKQSQDSLANRVRREVAWLRQGAKARTTKSKHRTQEAFKLIDNLKNSQFIEQRAALEFSASNRKSRELIKLDGISKSLGGKRLFHDISFVLSPGTRLGIVGPNGSGKTTFVKTLLGQITPDSGRVICASHLKINFFDQARKQLDKTVTLKRALTPQGGDSVIFNDRSLHVASYAKRFMFSSEQLGVAVSSLSGGEQARLLLAQLMLKESDIILFDEPTNDLDIDTLEVLEESFSEFPGAIVLVTHDRYLLDRTSTHILGLSSTGGEFFSSYLQWENSFLDNQVRPGINKQETTAGNQPNKTQPTKTVSANNPDKTVLSSQEQKELKGIEAKITKAEKLLEELTAEVDRKNQEGIVSEITKACQAVAQQQQTVEDLYARWQDLESRK